MSRRPAAGASFRRHRNLVGCTAVIAALALATPAAQAVIDRGEITSTDHEHEFVDVRLDDAVAPTSEQQAALADLEAAGARITWDERFGTPRTILTYGDWLTGPRSGDATDVARAFVAEHRVALGLSAEDADALAVTGDHELPGTGTRVINLAQTFGGVQTSRGGSMTVAVDRDGRVVSYSGATVRDGALTGDWEMDAGAALTAVAADLGGEELTATVTGEQAGYQVFDAGPFAAASYVQQVAFPTADGVTPAYRVLFVKALDEAWDVVVDARSGTELYRTSLVQHEGEGTVYENFPGAPGGGEPVIESFGPTEQSPSGYLDPSGVAGLTGITTAGNNANTYANYSNFLVPADQGPRPVSATGQFNYSYSQNWQRTEGETVPPSYVQDLDPAATNLFWHHNRIHDEFYELGFTESAGNFQLNNNGAGGNGADPILGLVHAGAISGGEPTYTGRDNAYMLTLPDGIPPWSGMFLWEPIDDAFEGPYSDGNFDATVIEHEYAHGLSNRYVSAEDGALNSAQSGAMGEGWGDWYGLNYLATEGLATDYSVVGEFATGNGERGIRNWAYDDNPLGYGDIGYDVTGPGVHADGEIWAATLWDLRKDLVAQFGEATGGEMAARLVTDAMPLSPMDPSMLDMRDAIVKAMDNRYHARADFADLANTVFGAFAQRGMGLGASTDTGNDSDPVPAFDHRNPALNGTIAGRVVNASTGEPVAGANVMLGVFEARVSPVAVTGDDGRFSVPATAGEYPVTIQASGFGATTYDATAVAAGQKVRSRYSLAPNLASTSNGAKVVDSTSPNAEAVLDDTEASTWTTEKGGNAVVELAQQATISSIQVSAYTTSRFEGLRDFTLQTSTDGVNWSTARSGQGFDYAEPRPTTPDLTYRTFELETPTEARFVRFWLDEPHGNTKTSVQAAELQVFAGDASGVTPLPPEPPDEPVTDEGMIVAGNPTGDVAQGVTGGEFAQACVMPPATQGADGWVTEVPDSFGDGKHAVEVTGSSLAGTHDLDLYFYDASCALVGSAASSAADESGALPSGTKYVLSQLWLGANVSIVVTATDTA